MAHLIPNIKQKFLDASGNPLVGGKLYSYAAGTTTPLATFTDETEGSSNTNPIILDGNGECQIWLGNSSYKFVLKDASDVVQFTVDNVAHINDLSITQAKLADGILTADVAGRAKMADGFVNTAKILDGALSLDAAGRAKMADGYLSADATGHAKMADGYLSADAAGRAKMADGFLSADSSGRAKMADGFVTRAKIESVGQQISSSSLTTTVNATTSYVDVSNLTATITTTGRPVFIGLIPDGNSNSALLIATANSSAINAGMNIKIVRNSSDIAFFGYQMIGGSASSSLTLSLPPSSIFHIDAVNVGTYTYKIQIASLSGSINAGINYAKLVVFEL